MLRSVYYTVGAEFIQGTWVQYAWLVLALVTVFMGSMLAFREPVFKKRLAYSSVSQASYILLGMAVLHPAALTGALMHVLFHAFIKTALFLTAGAVIYQTGCTRVDELAGTGKRMPVTLWCCTFVSLGLIGIPPMGGFISKWYLMSGMLESGTGVFSWLGPAVLLISALLTAGYLLPVTVRGFLPGKDYDYSRSDSLELSGKMTIPLAILAAASLLTGLFPGGIAGTWAKSHSRYYREVKILNEWFLILAVLFPSSWQWESRCSRLENAYTWNFIRNWWSSSPP